MCQLLYNIQCANEVPLRAGLKIPEHCTLLWVKQANCTTECNELEEAPTRLHEDNADQSEKRNQPEFNKQSGLPVPHLSTSHWMY